VDVSRCPDCNKLAPGVGGDKTCAKHAPLIDAGIPPNLRHFAAQKSRTARAWACCAARFNKNQAANAAILPAGHTSPAGAPKAFRWDVGHGENGDAGQARRRTSRAGVATAAQRGAAACIHTLAAGNTPAAA
ncbi:hypothetical protein, partial [Rivihabitans pingtungensis]|uniref:hypothetical protein n=1 Tax=Rivihabitans pingtungensis TaxID=1054498 RepID=UPI002C7A5490